MKLAFYSVLLWELNDWIIISPLYNRINTIPFDHMEYEKLDVYRDNWRYEHKSYYSKDKDGYDFMNGDFS